MEQLCTELARALPSATSGVAFVYAALERVVHDGEVADALVVVHEPLVGRQVFRAGRRPLAGSWAEVVAAEAAPGLYVPGGSVDSEVAAGVASLCAIALRLDVIGHDASHDALTGLLNRRSFDEALLGAVAQSRRYGWPFTLALFDVRGFKEVNDKLGHATGDRVLRELGKALRAGMRAGDVVARIGGDEFGLVLPNSSPELLPRLVQRLERKVGEGVPEAQIRLSIGVSRAPADATDADLLYRLADQRLYESRATR